jgi:hypothetical protein
VLPLDVRIWAGIRVSTVCGAMVWNSTG